MLLTDNVKDFRDTELVFPNLPILKPEQAMGGLSMATSTIQLPDDKHRLLKQLAKAKGIRRTS